jgi:putative membrane protein
MRHFTLALLSAATLALGACGHKADESASTNGSDTTGASNLDATAPAGANVGTGDAAANNAATATGGQAFANAAAASDAFEIASSQLARTAAKAPAVKTFASHMIEAHTASTASLKGAAALAKPGITPDPALTPDQQQQLDALKGKTGAAFDSAYAAAQVAAHQKALDTLRSYSAGGDVPQLKALATKMIPTVTAHLDAARGLGH